MSPQTIRWHDDTLLTQHVNDVLLREFDWSDWLVSPALIDASVWEVTPAVDGDTSLTVSDASIAASGLSTAVLVADGTAGRSYRLTNRITTDESPAQVCERSIIIQINAEPETLPASTTANTWITIYPADVTFTANNGATWSVDVADVSYLKYIVIRPGLAFVKGSIIASTLTGAPTELSMTVPGLTLAGNDTFDACIISNDGFATQTLGQVIGRAATGQLGFKKADGTAWAPVTNGLAVIFGVLVEL